MAAATTHTAEAGTVPAIVIVVTATADTPEPTSERIEHRGVHRINGREMVTETKPWGIYLVRLGRPAIVDRRTRTLPSGRVLEEAVWGDRPEVIGPMVDETQTRRGAVRKAEALAVECATASDGSRGSAIAVVVATEDGTVWHRAEVDRWDDP